MTQSRKPRQSAKLAPARLTYIAVVGATVVARAATIEGLRTAYRRAGYGARDVLIVDTFDWTTEMVARFNGPLPVRPEPACEGADTCRLWSLGSTPKCRSACVWASSWESGRKDRR